MLGKNQVTSLMLFVAAMHTIASGQCPTPSEIKGGNGKFQSPNHGKEYGKTANCTWRISSSSLTNYALKLDVEVLKLYIIQNGAKVCVHGSYNLSINGDLLPCDKFARVSPKVTFCHAYYNDDTCESLSDITGCEESQMAKFPVEVKYNADGRNISDDVETIMHGFKIGYQFIQCPGSATTTQPETTTLSTTTTVEDTTTVPGATKMDDVATVHDNAAPESSAYGKTSATSSITSSTSDSAAEFPLPLVVGAAGGGAIAILLIIMVIIICKKRKASAKSKPDQETRPTAHSSEIQMKKLEKTDTEESVAHTVLTGSSETLKGDTREEPPLYTAINRDNRRKPETKQDGAISNDIYATPKKTKGKKFTAKNSTNPTNQDPELALQPDTNYILMTDFSPMKSPTKNSVQKEDSHRTPQDIYAVPAKSKKHQSSNEPEQDSAYTEINHAHKKVPKTAGVKQKPQDIYAVPSKSKKHQSSNEPEQDSTCTEINHAHKKVPKTTGVKQKPRDIYAVPAKSKKHQSSNEPEQDSTYTEINYAHKKVPKTTDVKQKPKDIYAVPSKSKKYQSTNEAEQDSAYTEINHAHKKVPKNSTSQTAGVGQKPQDLYAVPSKSNKHQTSSEPEQDPTYTEISYTPESTPKISSTDQKSNEGGDIYTEIQKNPAKINPLVDHTQKQGDHTVTERSGDLYASVEQSAGVKKTINYEKETKDNVLYVAAP